MESSNTGSIPVPARGARHVDDVRRRSGTGAAARTHDGRGSGESRRLVGSDVGATAVEYALLLACIAALIFGAVVTVGLMTAGLYVVPCLNGPTCS